MLKGTNRFIRSPTTSPSNAGEATPITVNGNPFSRMSLLMIEPEPENLFCQYFIGEHDNGMAPSAASSPSPKSRSGRLYAQYGEIISAHHASRDLLVGKLGITGIYLDVMVRRPSR